MRFDPEIHRRLAAHLAEVERVLKSRGVSADERESILDDLTSQINAMLADEGDEECVLSNLDEPSRYDRLETVENPHRRPTSTSAEPPKRSNRIAFGVISFLLVVAAAAIAIVVWMVSVRNDILTADEMVDASYAQVETVLQRRFDLIPNLVATVKGFAEQEKEIFTEVARLRSQWGEGETVEEKVTAANRLEGKLAEMIAISENYPQLRSSEQFSQLQFQLEGTENRISVERNRYNNAVRHYNTRARRFPGSVFGFETKTAYFEAVAGAEKAPSVTF